MSSFEELGLSQAVLRAVNKCGYETPTPIQTQSIPFALEGRDIIGASQTGTGKTAAFALPIISRMTPGLHPQCLVLEPTRELAAQVEEEVKRFSYFRPINSVLLHGGVGYGDQLDGLERKPDIILATPGRLLDHIEKGHLSLGQVQYLVLDEVDRMLDMGFLPDVRKIVNQCRKQRQTLFFSATMPPAIESFAEWALDDPVEIEIGERQSPAETVNHAFYPVAMDQRDELLLALVKATDYKSLMIFTRTKKEADSLHSMLERSSDARVGVLHSDIRQNERTKALQGFRNGDFDIIIATDLAARGLDVTRVSHVINYRVPENAEDYVHRIGRTGRAEQEGDAFTILSGDELDNAKAVEAFIDKKIERRKLDGFDYVYTALLDEHPPKPVRKRRPPAPRRRK